ncbi:MAG: carbohydrate ABC transporter permease [Anaerolineae bacterium]
MYNEIMGVSGRRVRRSGGLRHRQAVEGYLYVSPWVLGFLAFTLFPMVASLYLAFTTYSGSRPPVFIGLQNFHTMLSTDFLFTKSLYNTAYYVVFSVPLGLCGSFLLAALLNQIKAGTNIFRTLFFLPSLTPTVATVILWVWIFHPQFGVLNWALSLFGVDGPEWLASPSWAKPALIVMSLWGIGGSTMIIFLAGLQNIPQEFYDAVAVDGGGWWARARHVTLPMISPVMFFNLVLGIISSFQVFTAAYVATEGGPGYATFFYVLNIFFQAFRWSQFGYASALAWVLVLILLVFTYLQFRLAGLWVYYEAG